MKMENKIKDDVVIDIHTHMFNHKYIPIVGILRQILRDWIPGWIRKVLLAMFEKIFSGNLIEKSISVEWDFRKFASNSNDLLEKLVELIPIEKDEDLEWVQQLFEKGADERDFNTFLDSMGQYKLSSSREAEDNFESFHALDNENRRLFITEFLNYAVDNADNRKHPGVSLKQLFLLAWLLTRPEEDIIKKYLDTYGKDESKPDQEIVFVHHMVDFWRAWKEKSPDLFKTVHIKKINELVVANNGRMLAFVAFDPFRDDSLEIIKEALANGFCGVKFYPPCGYRPFANSNEQMNDYAIDAEEVDKRVLDLFLYCAHNDNQIPIMTHCTPDGFPAQLDYGLNSDPYYWNELLREHEEALRNIRLLFGHAGGEEAWFQDDPSHSNFKKPDWTKSGEPFGGKVFDLSTRYENIYCGLGYLMDVFYPEKLEIYIARMEYLLEIKGVNNIPFGEKLIYGSDWHMIVKENAHFDYLQKYSEILTEPGLAKFKRNVLFNNAVNFLNLPGFLARIPNLDTNVRDYVMKLIDLADGS